MDGQQTLFTLGGEHEQFNLAALNKINHLILIAAAVDVGMSGNLDGMRVGGLALQRVAQLSFELVGLRRLLNRHSVYFVA